MVENDSAEPSFGGAANPSKLYERLGELKKKVSPFKFAALEKKHGAKVAEIVDLLERTMNVNTKLSERIACEMPAFLTGFEKNEVTIAQVEEAVKWGNQLLLRNCKKSPVICVWFISSFGPKISKLDEAKWWRLIEATEKFVADPLAGMFLIDLAGKHAEREIDWVEFAEFALSKKNKAAEFMRGDRGEAKNWISDFEAGRKRSKAAASALLKKMAGKPGHDGGQSSV